MRLSEPLRVHTRQRPHSHSDEFSEHCKETCWFLFLLADENVRVGEHVHSSEQVHDQGPLDDRPSAMSQVRAVTRRRLVELQQQEFVTPVSEEAKKDTGEVECGDSRREHHNDPDHSDKDGEPVVVLDLLPRVLRLVLLLDDLLRFLLVSGAATVQAT